MIGERMKTQRLAKGMTLQDLSECSEVSIGTLSDLEAGRRRNPTITVAFKIASALGVSLSELAGDEMMKAEYTEQERELVLAHRRIFK